jgi:uncharacterized repeat protein (TIGR03803 family)
LSRKTIPVEGAGIANSTGREKASMEEAGIVGMPNLIQRLGATDMWIRELWAIATAIGRRASLVSILAAAIGLMTIASSGAREPGAALPPLPHAILQELAHDPEARRQFREYYATTPTAPSSYAAPKTALNWTALKNPFPGAQANVGLSNPLLLTDGTVIAHISCTGIWYRLSPVNGNYHEGIWSALAPMPLGYAPRFFASAILPDGRVIVEGGEYNNDSTACSATKQAETNLGAIYDPRTNTWRQLGAPNGWTEIGDGSGIVLADGSFLLSNCCDKDLVLFDEAKLTWSSVGGGGKFDSNSEENWTLLPNGDILTVDGYIGTKSCGTNSERFLPDSFEWVGAGSTIGELSGCGGSIPTHEAPTQILRPNGTVAAFGATASLASKNLPVHTAVYDALTQKWAAGPNMPVISKVNYTMADAPAAILPDGDVLIAASPGIWKPGKTGGYPPPTHFFIFDGKAFTQVGDVVNSGKLNSYEMNFLVLPTGEILVTETDQPGVAIFPAICCAAKTWAPTIASAPSTIVDGSTYTVTGTQFNGLTSGAAYGDDEQASTNYPLVRVTNNASKAVTYCATFNFSSMGVATGSAKVSTKFSCAAPAGASTLEVVANGIASAPVDVAVETEPLTVLYSFCATGYPNCPDGAEPFAALTMDPSRNLLGVTGNGGTNFSAGTIFELGFQAKTQDYNKKDLVLYNFCGETNTNCPSDPIQPAVRDPFTGDLLATAYLGGGGGNGSGAIIDVPFDAATNSYDSAATKILYQFCSKGGKACTDGSNPSGLIVDSLSNLYGTTIGGGANGGGTIFMLPFNLKTNKYAEAVQTLYSFCQNSSCSDGENPRGGVTMDASGNLFGTANGGGVGGNQGTVFELPYNPAAGKFASAIKVLYQFCPSPATSCPKGASPYAGVVLDAYNNLFGTTYQGGATANDATGYGVIFELPFSFASQTYASDIKVLHIFCQAKGCEDGASPSGLIIDPQRNLYGTAEEGGKYGPGVVFELPFNPTSGAYDGDTVTLHDFCANSSCPDGEYDLVYPAAPLIMDGLSRTFFSTTSEGGAYGFGDVFQLTP